MSVHGQDDEDSSPSQEGARDSSYTKSQYRGQGHHGGHHKAQQPHRYHSSKAWWSVGEFRHQGITHQSVGLSLGQNEDDFWDLSDSLVDLYEHVTQRQKKAASRVRTHNRSGSTGAVGGIDNETQVDIKRWLDEDSSHGFIRVFASDDDSGSRLFPCNLSTMSQKICLQLGIPGNSLHVQLSGHVIKRMEPFDCPLAIQNEYLAGLGYSDKRYIQEEGPKEDLSYLVRFYAGKPLSDYTYARNQLTTYAYVRKGKLRHQWARRRCVISGTRLLIYRDNESEPTTVQLAKGSVEEVQIKGQSLVLKLTSTLNVERSIFISFVSQDDYSKWLKKLKKATAKLPSKADLSNCHLEFLPETVFINTDLQVLILRHNALRERPFDEDIYTIGWLDDLPRFTSLRSLNLADNQLTSFPLALCEIYSLMELNLASNKLTEIPSQISELKTLQVLHLHNNLLSSLPEEISHMHKLTVVVLAFNRFVQIPSVLLQSPHAQFKLDSIIMAGNQIARLPAEQLAYMSHIKKIDLRLNRLQLLPTETAKFQSLEHVTHLDIRENEVLDLDIRAIRCLEYVNCDRNGMRSMQLNGTALKNLFASRNCLETLSINPKPEWLVSMDVSHNKLTSLPDWLSDCFFLVRLDVSHNNLKTLPERLLCGAPKLKIIKANHNRLTSLPKQITSETLEELHLQHNLIRNLSPELFIKAQRLRYLNVTRNKLNELPPPNKNESFNKLQELYLSFNHLGNEVWQRICCFPRLRVLHVARNKLSVMAEIDVEKLEQLTELNISSNSLTYLPSSLGRHPKLQILRASCNLLQELPNFKNSSALKVLEASSNHLVNVNMANLMASQVSLLDISANPNVTVKSHHMEAAKNSKQLCLIDMWGQNRSLDDISNSNQQRFNQLWQTGLSQTSGTRNKLCVATLSKPKFSDHGDALFGVFDGGRNDTVASLVCDIMPSVLKEERMRNKSPHMYMKYTMLSAHRQLKSHGQKLGASSVVAYIHPNDKGQHLLSIANVGDCQVVLCRHRKAMCLSRAFLADDDKEDTTRVIRSGGIITEDGRVSGVTYNTRLLGCSYLYPHVVPEPFVTTTLLTPEDSFLIIASHGLWEFVSREEAVREVKDIPDPVIAAKRLQDLAQGYGSRENLAILIVRLTMTPTEQTRISEQIKTQKSTEKELIKVLSQRNNLLHLRDGVPKDADVNGIVIDKSGHAKNKKHRSSRKHLLDASSSEKGSLYSTDSSTPSRGLPSYFETNSDVPFNIHLAKRDSNRFESPSLTDEFDRHSSSGDTTEKPPDETRLYKKRNDITDVLRKRITEDLKVRELRNTFEVEMHEESKNHVIEYEDDIDDNDDDIFIHDKEFEANWTAVKVGKNRPDKPEEWEFQLKQRLEQELLDNELKAVSKCDGDIDNIPSRNHEPGNDRGNWTTISISKPSSEDEKPVSKIVSNPIYKGKNISLPPQIHEELTKFSSGSKDVNQWISSSFSDDSLTGDVMQMMDNSSHSKTDNVQNPAAHDFNVHQIGSIPEEDSFNLSPSESVSSIDVRLHDEAEEIYQMRHMTNLQIAHSTVGESNDNDPNLIHMAVSALDPNALNGEHIKRPLSPDSIISLDDFVKPPIDNSNIDRDALLFHQMQMARAQAHSGSSASLDTVQSAPLNLPIRDIVADVRASSHSIEVLVNIGVDDDQRSFDQGSLNELGSTSTLKGSQERMPRSMNDITASKGRKKSIKLSRENIEHHVKHRKIAMTNDEKKNIEEIPQNANDNDGNDDDEDSDRDTLVGDADDVGNSLDIDGGDKEESRLAKVSFPHPKDRIGHGGDGEGYDSDDSLGNISLEDGYDAFEFIASSKRVTLSMTNVLENESDYQDVHFSKGKKGQSDDLDHNKVTSRDIETIDEGESYVSKSGLDDYEDIDVEEEGEEDRSKGRVIDISYVDDIDPYEIFQCEPEEERQDERNKETEEDVPTEEDIDALYAKVNKIKLKKLLAEENDDGDAFLNFMQDFTSNNHGYNNNENDNEMSFSNHSNRNAYNSIDSSDEEQEIFITSSDSIPISAREIRSDQGGSSSFSPPSSPPAFFDLPDSTQNKTKRAPAPAPPTSSPLSKSTPPNPLQSPPVIRLTRPSSFKPASHSTTIPKPTYNPHLKPEVPPKTYLESSISNSKQDGKTPAKVPVHSSKASTAPLPPPSSSSSNPPVHIFLPFKTSEAIRDEQPTHKPIPLPRTYLNSVNRSPAQISQNSTHRPSDWTPSPHPPPSPTHEPLASMATQAAALAKGLNPKPHSQSGRPVPIDMQPASRQLPTQKSIIITYL